MGKTITQRELRNDSGRILRAAERGEEFTVTRNGTPVAHLGPLASDRVFVSKEEMKRGMAGAPHLDYRRLRADLEEAFDIELSDPYERRDG